MDEREPVINFDDPNQAWYERGIARLIARDALQRRGEPVTPEAVEQEAVRSMERWLPAGYDAAAYMSEVGPVERFVADTEFHFSYRSDDYPGWHPIALAKAHWLALYWGFPVDERGLRRGAAREHVPLSPRGADAERFIAKTQFHFSYSDDDYPTSLWRDRLALAHAHWRALRDLNGTPFAMALLDHYAYLAGIHIDYDWEKRQEAVAEYLRSRGVESRAAQ